MSFQNKTEQATPKKRQDTRNEGRVAKSTDFNTVMVLLASIIMLKTIGPYVADGLISITRDTFTNLHSRPISVDTVPALAVHYGTRMALICLPLMLTVGAVGLVSNVMQVGLKVTTKSFTPNLNKLDPMKGLTRIFSSRALFEALKSVIKISAVGYAVYSFLSREYHVILSFSWMNPSDAVAAIGMLCWRLVLTAWVAMLIIAAIDLIYQRKTFEKSIMMTKQEIKDEYKQAEGDPKVKSKIRQRQQEIATRRMMQDVPMADVVIANPIHIAIAIKYNPATMSAPTVVAKGQRLVAQKIKAIAEASGVPIVENPPIARMLYKLVEVGHQIPDHLYHAVAEILAYVYKLNEKAGKSRQAAWR